MTKTYEVHPYCAAFPDIEGEEFEALREDLKMHGQQEPCWVYENWLLDGKNRQRALTANKQPVRYEKWAPFSNDPEQHDREIREFCISKNLRRRHLNESQRAMVAAKLSPPKDGIERAPHGKFAARKNSQKTTEIAESMNVSERSVRSAKTVVEHAAPEIVHAVEVGKVSVSDAAKVAELPKAEQKAALKKVENGQASTLAKAADVKPSTASVVRNGNKTVVSKPYDPNAIEKSFGALARQIDDMASSCNLNNSPHHRQAIGFLTKAMDEWKVLLKECDAAFARRSKA